MAVILAAGSVIRRRAESASKIVGSMSHSIAKHSIRSHQTISTYWSSIGEHAIKKTISQSINRPNFIIIIISQADS